MGNGLAIFGLSPPPVVHDPALLTAATATEILQPHQDSARQLSLILAGRGSRGLRSQGANGARGGGPLQGGGNGGGKKNSFPVFFLARIFFEPSRRLDDKLFDIRLLEVAHHRLGGVITDAVLVTGNFKLNRQAYSIAMHRSIRNLLSDLAKYDDPDKRFAELISMAQGKILDGAFGQNRRKGFPLVRVSGTGSTSIREYRFYQKEGPPIIVTFRGAEGTSQRRQPIAAEGLRVLFGELERTFDQMEVADLRRLVDNLRGEVRAPSQTETYITFAQSFALTLEAQNSGRYSTQFFDALWRLIYQVRMARITQQKGKVLIVERSHQAVLRYLDAAARP